MDVLRRPWVVSRLTRFGRSSVGGWSMGVFAQASIHVMLFSETDCSANSLMGRER